MARLGHNGVAYFSREKLNVFISANALGEESLVWTGSRMLNATMLSDPMVFAQMVTISSQRVPVLELNGGLEDNQQW